MWSRRIHQATGFQQHIIAHQIPNQLFAKLFPSSECRRPPNNILEYVSTQSAFSYKSLNVLFQLLTFDLFSFTYTHEGHVFIKMRLKKFDAHQILAKTMLDSARNRFISTCLFVSGRKERQLLSAGAGSVYKVDRSLTHPPSTRNREFTWPFHARPVWSLISFQRPPHPLNFPHFLDKFCVLLKLSSANQNISRTQHKEFYAYHILLWPDLLNTQNIIRCLWQGRGVKSATGSE